MAGRDSRGTDRPSAHADDPLPATTALQSAVITVGEPDVVDGLADLPSSAPGASRRSSTSPMRPLSAPYLRELPGGASVNHLHVTTPLGAAALLYEG